MWLTASSIGIPLNDTAASTVVASTKRRRRRRLRQCCPPPPSPSIMPMAIGLRRSSSAPDACNDHDVSSLLSVGLMPINSTSISGGGRDRSSGRPLRTSHYHGHSLPLPTSASDRAAWRSVGRPTTLTNSMAIAAPPRPTPAGLLASSSRPQPGRVTQQGVRAGFAPRSAGRNRPRQIGGGTVGRAAHHAAEVAGFYAAGLEGRTLAARPCGDRTALAISRVASLHEVGNTLASNGIHTDEAQPCHCHLHPGGKRQCPPWASRPAYA